MVEWHCRNFASISYYFSWLTLALLHCTDMMVTRNTAAGIHCSIKYQHSKNVLGWLVNRDTGCLLWWYCTVGKKQNNCISHGKYYVRGNKELSATCSHSLKVWSLLLVTENTQYKANFIDPVPRLVSCCVQKAQWSQGVHEQLEQEDV